jgi:hypothetical protein
MKTRTVPSLPPLETVKKAITIQTRRAQNTSGIANLLSQSIRRSDWNSHSHNAGPSFVRKTGNETSFQKANSSRCSSEREMVTPGENPDSISARKSKGYRSWTDQFEAVGTIEPADSMTWGSAGKMHLVSALALFQPGACQRGAWLACLCAPGRSNRTFQVVGPSRDRDRAPIPGAEATELLQGIVRPNSPGVPWRSLPRPVWMGKKCLHGQST